MARTAFIYLAALTFAEFMFTGRAAQAGDSNPIVFETMTPVVADGKDKAPKIMDFTKDPDADKPVKGKKVIAGN